MPTRTRHGAAAPGTGPGRAAPNGRRHLSPATRAALARTRSLCIDLGGVEVLGIASAPPDEHEAPLVLHSMAYGDHALVVVHLDELPPRIPHAVHPVLLQLGGRARGYVHDQRRRRRRAIGRHTAAFVLGSGVIAAMATLGFAGAGADGRALHAAQGTANPGADVAGAARIASIGGASAHAVAARVIEVSSPPSAHRSPSTATGPAASSGGAFSGAWAFTPGVRVWVPYPANPADPFLACTRSKESVYAGGYRAADKGWVHLGAYQFLRSTWNTIARTVGRSDLVGVSPRDARPADQDWMALYLYRWQGASPWQGRCAGL